MISSLFRSNRLGWVLIVVGSAMSLFHILHIGTKETAITIVIGGILPLFVSLALVVIGHVVRGRSDDVSFSVRIVGWILLGMAWSSVVGTGTIIYVVVGGLSIDQAGALLAIFATYGIVPGAITGWYDYRQKTIARELKAQAVAMDHAHDGMGILNSDGEFTYVNPSLASMHGYDESIALIGEPWQVLYESGEVAEFETEIRPALEENGKFTGSTTGLQVDGTTFPQRFSMATLPDGGYVSVVRDITEEVERERAFHILNRVLRHNISNDLNVILGQAGLIGDNTTGDLNRAARTIQEVGESIVELVQKERQIAELVLDVSKPEPMTFETILEHAIVEIEQRYPNATVAVESNDDCPVVKGIPDLERAIIELLENGVIHADSENPTVEIDWQTRKNRLSVAIRDECEPIPVQDRQVITGKHEIDALFHGSGLGLWYVYWVLQAIDGTVSFDHSDGGNEVTLDLERWTGSQ